MHENHLITRVLVTTIQKLMNKVQGWRIHQAGKITYKIDAYKWINPHKDSTYKSNHINSPIG